MVIDHSGAATFAMTIGCNTNLANTARSFDHISGVGVKHQRYLKTQIGIVIHELDYTPGENCGFNKNHSKCTPLTYLAAMLMQSQK